MCFFVVRGPGKFLVSSLVVIFTPHINDFASFQEPKDAATRGHDDDAKLMSVETAAKPESKVSLASGCHCIGALVDFIGSLIIFTPHINDFASFQEPKDAAAHGHDDDAKLVPVETAAKPESKVSLVSLASGCHWSWLTHLVARHLHTTHQ